MTSQPPPADVYLDTSVIVAALFPGTTNSTAAYAFCRRLAAHGSHIYFSQILRVDLAQALRRLATKPHALPPATRTRYQLDRWATDFMVRQAWLTTGVQQFDAFLGQFTEVVEIPFRLKIWHQSIGVMALESLQAEDATHLATARGIGISDFATTDSDFRRIRSPNIHLIHDATSTA